MNTNTYKEYFEIDEQYFPSIGETSIEQNPDLWLKTYPHDSFISILEKFEKCLAKKSPRSLWIEGTYGTGKSQCAYALQKILTVPEEELQEYWQKWDELRDKPDLCEKLIGHRQKGIITAYRYGSGNISSVRELFRLMQESIKKSLESANLYTGNNTLRESVAAWLEIPKNMVWFDETLKEYRSFSQESAAEVLEQLRQGGEIANLMKNIFAMAEEQGITAINLTTDDFIAWLKDVIDQNNVKIVVIWDEFSEYFKHNNNSLSELQKLTELVQSKPFYFIPITHEVSHIFLDGTSNEWDKIRDRFERGEITLPDNIAFKLIGGAFQPITAAIETWAGLANNLNERLKSSRAAVMSSAKIKDSRNTQNTIKNIMPLHPMTALVLKNIAVLFQSNQRSIFDFIKSQDSDKHTFSWYIENHSPHSEFPLLTVDMLWHYFYEEKKADLTSDIRLILDVFPMQAETLTGARKLTDDQKAVLKAILIMSAVNQKLGGSIEILKPTDTNIAYVFEGTNHLEGTAAINCARQLVDKNLLIDAPQEKGGKIYSIAIASGDQAKIDLQKKDLLVQSTTQKLAEEGEMGGLFNLSSPTPALRLRYSIDENADKLPIVALQNFTKTINDLSGRQSNWQFKAVIAFAKDETEMLEFRKKIESAVADKKYQNILFISAVDTPLGLPAFEKYLDFKAMSLYHVGSNKAQHREENNRAKEVLKEWRKRLEDGSFTLYTFENQKGEKVAGASDILRIMQKIVLKKFPNLLEFSEKLTIPQLKKERPVDSAKMGVININAKTKGTLKNVEQKIFSEVWELEEYWKKLPNLQISKIKIAVDNLINERFSLDGQIEIGDIYSYLQEFEGFAPCNLTAFIVGFLLKEYSEKSYRYADENGASGEMTAEKLGEMIGNHIQSVANTAKKSKPTRIIKMTAEERAFYTLTDQVWGVPEGSCSSVSQAARAITQKMRTFHLPVWCLAEVDTANLYGLVEHYIKVVQLEGAEAQNHAIKIGATLLAAQAAKNDDLLTKNLAKLLTLEQCQAGMRKFLERFEEGKILELAQKIGAADNILSDIRRLFGVENSYYWDKDSGEKEIRKLLAEYGTALETNKILNTAAHSLTDAYKEWREFLKFFGISHEAISAKFPSFATVFNILFKICKHSEVLPDQLRKFLSKLEKHGDSIKEILFDDKLFSEIYQPYLENLTDEQIAQIKANVGTGLFAMPKTECNAVVKRQPEELRKSLLKTELTNLWREKTGTKTPEEWSRMYKTPILSCVPPAEFEQAKTHFATIKTPTSDREIKAAIEFLKTATFFDILGDSEKRNAAFIKDIIGDFTVLLPNIDEIREILEQTGVEPYNWRDNPDIKTKIDNKAKSEYDSGGSDKVLAKIDEMNDKQLKLYLKRLIKNSMTVGIEILTTGTGGENE
ncbi:MAG: hypothetical protein FWG68_10315 [Defluviitaleaceae bacterium]|nr:hypothetical protein [Defluviitaleaceae bacterium]